jgi:catechol 2,3-dioxygenase-like lactoylglutathione lyase family enzyme
MSIRARSTRYWTGSDASLIHHIDFAVADLARSREFYARALLPLGIRPMMEVDRDDGRRGTGFGTSGDPMFWIGGGRAIQGRFHLAFQAASRAAVNAFHAAALEAGGRDNGAPGLRPQYGEHYYAAFVLDPDGHNVEAVCRLPG